MASHVTTSQPFVAPTGVAIGVAEINRTGLAPGAQLEDDARRSITFIPRELAPWRVRVDFLVYDLCDRTHEYVVVGHELALPISLATADAEPDTAQRLYPAISARFAKHVDLYYRQAELLLRSDREELGALRMALLNGKAHKHHRLLVADYRARKGGPSRISDMARAFNVHRTIIWRELRDARDEGLISEDELEQRQPAV